MLGEEIGHADESAYVAAKEQAEADDPESQVPREKFMKFFMTILPAFLPRVRPASSMAKPGCMKKTRTAAMRIQKVSTDE